MLSFEDYVKLGIRSPILDDLRQSLASSGVANIEYTCSHSFEYECQLSRAYARENIEPSKILTFHYLFSGERAIQKALFNYFSKHAAYDLDYFLEQTDRIQMYLPDLKNVNLQGMFDDFIIAGSFATAFFFVKSAGVVGAFHLFSPLSVKEFEKRVCNSGIEAQLIAAHHKLYQAHQEQLNPWTNHGLLSDNALQVLVGICNGQKLDAIASQLNMTKRGVDYHLSHLKSIFEAQNNCNLVAKALALGAVDGAKIVW